MATKLERPQRPEPTITQTDDGSVEVCVDDLPVGPSIDRDRDVELRAIILETIDTIRGQLHRVEAQAIAGEREIDTFPWDRPPDAPGIKERARRIERVSHYSSCNVEAVNTALRVLDRAERRIRSARSR